MTEQEIPKWAKQKANNLVKMFCIRIGFHEDQYLVYEFVNQLALALSESQPKLPSYDDFKNKFEEMDEYTKIPLIHLYNWLKAHMEKDEK